jgi:hypothetical protein
MPTASKREESISHRRLRDAPNNNQGGGAKRSLSISTENILPAWIPTRFSFEVVRRPPNLQEPVDVN